jgi:hypothetical protein
MRQIFPAGLAMFAVIAVVGLAPAAHAQAGSDRMVLPDNLAQAMPG